MRSLIVLVLLALALPGQAEDICPTGSLSSTTVATSSPGQTYTASGCTINGTVRLSAYDTPMDSVPISITVENSVVNRLLDLYFLSLSNAPTRPPIYATIQNNVFNNNAGLYAHLSLPPNSIVTFQNNQMNGDGSEDPFEYGIAIMIYFESFNLFPNVTLNVVSNTLSLNSVNPNAQTGLLILALVAVAGNCTVNVLNNTVKAFGVSEGYLMYMGWDMGDNSTLQIESNTLLGNTSYSLNAMRLDVEAIAEAPELRSFSVTDVVEGQNNWVSFSNNVISMSGSTNFDQVIYGSKVKANLRVDGNSVIANHPVFIYFEGSFSPAYYASITGNSFASTTSITSPPIYVLQFNFAANSTLVIARNTFTAPTVTATPLLMEIATANIEPGASIKYCGNTLPWTNSSTTVDELFSADVAGLLVYDADACVVPTTTTATTTTTTPTTTTPTPTTTTTTPTTTTTTATTSTSVFNSTSTVVPSSFALTSASYAAIVCLVVAMMVSLA